MEEQKEEKIEQEQTVCSDQSDYISYIEDAKEEFNDAESKEEQFIIKNLFLIKENLGCILGDHADLSDISFGGGKKKDDNSKNTFISDECVVENKEKLISWLRQHYNDFEMAFLITLAVFEKAPHLWVYDMAEKLFELMEGDKEEAELSKIKIPRNQRIKVIGGRKYIDFIYNHTGRMESEFICFQKPEYAKRVLQCVWDEFLFFREVLIKWLMVYISDRNYSKTIMAINAFGDLARIDFDYFNKYVTKIFFSKNEFIADFAISQIMGQVHKDDRYKNNIERLFNYWSREGNINYSLTALMIGVNEGWTQERVQFAVEGYINQLLMEMKANRGGEYRRQLPVFFKIGNRKAVYFKAIVAVLYDKLTACRERREKAEKILVGLAFFLLLQIDDQQSNIDVNRTEKHKGMIFVWMCLIKNDTTPKVRELWKYIWKSREFHKLTKDFLEKYLYQYGGCKQSEIDYLRQFLYSFQDSEEDRNNMDYFLKKISLKNKWPVRTAERINNI